MLRFFSGRSKEQAKNRLMLVLSYERLGISPNLLFQLKQDLVGVFQKYPQFDSVNIEVEIKNQDRTSELWISIPFRQ
ncbi:MAG: cell division topological specificity factor MinE [Aquificaceae bacterium]